MTPRPRHTAFLDEHVDLDRPLPWRSRWRWAHDDWLLRAASQAVREGHSRHCPGADGMEVPVAVLVDGHLRGDRTPVVMAMRWVSATGFPILDGDLELRAPGPDTCRLRLAACFRQPVDAVGDAPPTAFEDIAARTAGSFLGLVGAQLPRRARARRQDSRQPLR